jgi:hypothetical protein
MLIKVSCPYERVDGRPEEASQLILAYLVNIVWAGNIPRGGHWAKPLFFD